MSLFLYQTDKTYGTGKRVVGTYRYLKKNIPIDLTGEIHTRSQQVDGRVSITEADIVLYELDEDGQPSAKFIGTIEDGKFAGSWQKIGSQETLRVTMKKTSVSPLRRTKKAIFEVNTGRVSYALDLGDGYNCVPELDTAQSYSDGEVVYVFATFSYATNCQCRSRGSCGCGLEQYATYLVASATDYRVLEHAIYNIHSCANAIESSFFQDGRVINVEDVNLHTFQNLILEVHDLRNNKEVRHVLKRETMEKGFTSKLRSP